MVNKKRILYVGESFTFNFKCVKDNDPNTSVAITAATVTIKESRDGVYDTAVVTDAACTVATPNFSYQVTAANNITDVPRDCIAIWKITTVSPVDIIEKVTYFEVRDPQDQRNI